MVPHPPVTLNQKDVVSNVSSMVYSNLTSRVVSSRGSTSLGDEHHLSSNPVMLLHPTENLGTLSSPVTINDHDTRTVLSYQNVDTLPSNCTVTLFSLQ